MKKVTFTCADLEIGKCYDVVTLSRACYTNVTLVSKVKFRYDFRDSSDLSMLLAIYSSDIGPGRYAEVYVPGLGERVHDLRKTIDLYKRQKPRFENLRERGYKVESRPMGSGGVGQVRVIEKEIRVQVGAAYTKWGYAMCVILPIDVIKTAAV